MSCCGCVRTLGVKTTFVVVTIAMSVGTVGFSHCRAFSASESAGGGESTGEGGEGDEEREWDGDRCLEGECDDFGVPGALELLVE